MKMNIEHEVKSYWLPELRRSVGIKRGQVIDDNGAVGIQLKRYYPEDVISNDGTSKIGELLSIKSSASEIDAAIQIYVNVKNFGATGDGTTDDTDAFILARNTLSNNGFLYVPKGTYVLNEFALNSVLNQKYRIGLIGAPNGGTIIRSKNASKFSIILDATTTSNDYTESISGCFVENIIFDGTVGNIKKSGCGLFAPREHFLKNVSFINCAIGYVSGDNYYLGGSNVKFYRCFVAMINGSFSDGNRTFTNIIDANNINNSVTLPRAMNNPNGHSGNKIFDMWSVKQCTFGIVIISGTDTNGYSPYIIFNKLTIEETDVALIGTNCSIELKQPWFESNGTTGATVLNGVSYNNSSIYLSERISPASFAIGFGGMCHIEGGKLGKVVVLKGGLLEIDKYCFITNDIENNGGSVLLDDIRIDNTPISAKVKNPIPLTTNGRAALTLSDIKYKKKILSNKNVLAFDDLSASSIVHPKISTTSALSFNNTGGVFDLQKYALISSVSFGFNFLIGSDLEQDSFYEIYLCLKVQNQISFSVVNAVGFVAPLAYQPILPLNEWVAVKIITRSQSISGNPRLVITNPTGTEIGYSGVSISKFKTIHDLKEYSTSLYIN